MPALTWPICTLTPADVRASPSGQAALQGGRTLSGATRVAQWSAGGIWRATYQRVLLRTRNQLLTASALDGYMDGGAGVMIVPRRPGIMSPDQPDGVRFFSDGASFSDGSGFTSGWLSTLAADVAMSATTVVIRRPVGLNPLLGGEDWSVMKDFIPEMHRIVRILSTTLGGEFIDYEVEVRPPFRDDQAAGSPVNFTSPVFLARITNPEEFSAMVKQGRHGQIDVQFEEV